MGRPLVTSEFVRTPTASPVSAGARIMALIGTGGTSFTIQERVLKLHTKAAGGSDVLAHTATSIVKVGDFKGTTDYTVTTEYTLDTGTIKWVATKGPEKDAYYYVTYVYAKSLAAGSTDYSPYLTSSFSEVVAKSGGLTSTAGALDTVSYLSAAAQLAFDIGVSAVIICQVEANTAAEFKLAYDKLENPVSGINPYYIVPLLGSLATSGDFDTAKGTALAHCNKMASEEFGKERQLYTGKKDYTGSGFGVDDFTTEAGALGTSRVILSGNFDPIRSMTTIESAAQKTQSIILDGCFDAVKNAAFRCTQLTAEPAMNRAITGAFVGYNTVWGDIDIDTLVDGSVCVSEVPSAGIIKIVDDITTDNSDEVEVDIATVETRDRMIMMARQGVSDKFKGARGTNSVSSDLKSWIDTFLDQRLADRDISIAAKGKIDAKRQTGSIRKWEIDFTYLPVTKVRDVNIKFSVDLGLAI